MTMAELDWIVEREELPPDELDYPAPDPVPPPRRVPGWIWLVVGVTLVTMGVLVILWILGDTNEPLPPPEPELASLESAVELEISALNNGDREIYDRQQDDMTRRRNHQPPPEVWFAAEERLGQFTLLDLKLLGAAGAWADVSVEWDGTLYRLVWFYRQAGDRWLHTDWPSGELTRTLNLTTTHLVVEYRPEEAREATRLAARSEELIAEFCSLVSCVDGGAAVKLSFDRVYVPPMVDRIGDLLRIPAPLQFRWPLDGEPEPLIMGSVARHLVERLVIAQNSSQLDRETRGALSTVAYWLAHHLLTLEPLPATTWLNEVERREGITTVAALIDGMQSGVPPQQAIRDRLRPETVAAVTGRPDYMAWLALIAQSTNNLSRSHYDMVNPWAPAGQRYDGLVPELVDVVHRGDWAIGISAPDAAWPPAHFFRLEDGDWRVSSQPDDSLIGERKERVAGPFTITYYEWDEPFIDQVVQMLTEAHEQVAANFLLAESPTYQVMVMPYPDFPAGGEIVVHWPTLSTWRGEPAVADQTLLMVAGSAFGRYVELNQVREEGSLILLGLYLWQLEELGFDTERYYGLIELAEAKDWHPPPTADDEAWLPLAQLWQVPTNEPPQHKLAQYLWTPYLLTQYIVETYGRDKVKTMSGELAMTNSIEEWIETVTGQPANEFEMEWHEWVIVGWAERSD